MYIPIFGYEVSKSKSYKLLNVSQKDKIEFFSYLKMCKKWAKTIIFPCFVLDISDQSGKKFKKSIIEYQLFKKKFKKKMKKDFVYSKNGRIFATSKHENESCLT